MMHLNDYCFYKAPVPSLIEILMSADNFILVPYGGTTGVSRTTGIQRENTVANEERSGELERDVKDGTRKSEQLQS
jgi:hypothetical protein